MQGVSKTEEAFCRPGRGESQYGWGAFVCTDK